mmetsp:Transcript_1349/g.3340  ORF Transcript_1349/g.3340 Transcript_1349/m.3340 type:complete len:488 (+) Transcript_1349:59-1522(+)
MTRVRLASRRRRRRRAVSIAASCLVFVALAAAMVVVAASAAAAANTCDSSSSSFSDAEGLRKRVASALDRTDDVSLTEEGRSLRATVDDVLSADECRFLVERFPPRVFLDAGGYESTSNEYNAPRRGYSGIGLNDLAGKSGGGGGEGDDDPILPTEDDYERFLGFRERIRARTEEALSLRPGTLRVDYTHVSQKTAGGTHRPHADNCFHYYRETTGDGGGQDGASSSSSSVAATLDPTRKHPYANRVAASILYLNDRGYEGGEFYWADRSSPEGTPETVVPPREGRMSVFTSGIENLHGALPVREKSGGGGDDGDDLGLPSRRLALAMWYVASDDPAETVPEYGRTAEGTTEEEEDPHRTLLFEIPVGSIRVGALRLALGVFLVGRQNTPSRNSWTANQNNENTLYMIFGDRTVMISIVLKPGKIIVSRHTDGIHLPSLMYQLQESVLLHAILTEIETLAFGKEEGNRLVEVEKAAIDEARGTLPTR